ncbi:DUF58 domain-containing protein [Aquincola sp. MAHUQ-54]|uniref:DUF58 domain-containing protein n=1 Tax=Aquincola agrisoli TaxID=3119538 RepID=A0AAW9Q8Y2_9BURK
MWAALRTRVKAWWQARHPRTDRWVLTQRNIYILPTRAGLAFGVTLAVMLLASINYQLNLGYILTFLLAGAGFASLHITHATLRGLTLHLRPVAPCFAGEPARIDVVAESPGRQRHGIGVGFDARAQRDQQVWVDVPALGQATAVLRFVPPRRGSHPVPALRAETRFPFGLFKAWTVWRPAAQALAWPAPEHPPAPLPPAQPLAGPGAAMRQRDGGEFDGVRAYRRGDALRSVVWKKAARTGELVTRENSGAASRELWLDWQLAGAQGAEARLSRLAAWVLAAEGAGVLHGLRLPGVELPPGQGDAHRLKALQALATWSEASAR